ncbi:Sly1, SM superfamily protein, partial [Emiliania huxleyi CCMP1516]
MAPPLSAAADNPWALRSRQLSAISRMINLDREEADASGVGWHDPWKVLVYDSFCRDVISPLLKVGDLRKRGVTLHLLLDAEREQIAD